MSPNPDFILASASPRRRDLLQQIGCRFLVSPAAIDEVVLSGEAPIEYVKRIALQKARAGWVDNSENELPVLAADTAVVLGRDDQGAKIFGKPRDQEHAVSMLLQLSGTTHRVLSAVAMVRGVEQEIKQRENRSILLSETLVTFRSISKTECEQYWYTGEPQDKAGAYAIQGLGAVFVESLSGSYSGVVGLPLAETCELLAKFDIPWWVGS
ncbi:MAG: septum formation protein Maf [Porticoccaceae bacterium]|nr:MAG: septum formation protein Maf [Porticoccaceae bacterium]